MKRTDQDPVDFELGNALADRLGLNHATTLREYDVKASGRSKVVVTMHSALTLDKSDYEDLRRVAEMRAKP